MQIHTPTVVQEEWMNPPPLPLEFLIYCNISTRFYLQWRANDLLRKMRYIVWVVALPGIYDVTNSGRHLRFYQESSGAEVVFSKTKLRKTLRDLASPLPSFLVRSG